MISRACNHKEVGRRPTETLLPEKLAKNREADRETGRDAGREAGRELLGFDITQMPLYVVQKYEYHGRYRLVANVLEQLKNHVEYYAQTTQLGHRM